MRFGDLCFCCIFEFSVGWVVFWLGFLEGKGGYLKELDREKEKDGFYNFFGR